MIKKTKNTDVLDENIQNFKKLKYSDFIKNHQRYMRILDYDQFMIKV